MSLLLRRGIISGSLSSGFVPANAIGWWDASDTATITGSPSVSQLDDKVGTEHLVQGTASARPSTGTRTQNSLNVLDCDGGDFMEKTSFPIPSDGDVVFYIIAGIDSVSNNNDSVLSTSGTNDFSLRATTTSNFRAGIKANGIGSNILGFGSNKNGPSLYKAVFDFTGAGQYSVFVDGVENSDGPNTYSSKLSATSTLNIFENDAGGQEPNGFFAEIIIVPSVDTDIEDYLKAKWNTP